jgi:hypothetical protein
MAHPWELGQQRLAPHVKPSADVAAEKWLERELMACRSENLELKRFVTPRPGLRLGILGAYVLQPTPAKHILWPSRLTSLTTVCPLHEW